MIRDKNNDEHAITSSRPSHCPRRPAIRAAIGHAPAAVISLSLSIAPAVFQARPAGRCLSATHHRLVSRLVLSRLAERLVHISDCLSMPYSLYRSVGPCSSGLAHSRLIARRRYHHIHIIRYIHRILVSLYSCIFYIHRIHHIHYIHSSTRHDEPRLDSQAAAVPPPVPTPQIERDGTRQER